MTSSDLHHDYLLICEMRSDVKKRCRMLTELMSQYEWAWRVVGITEAALQRFEEYQFKKQSRMGINRSHITPRIQTYTRWINHPILDVEDWWQDYIASDITVLSTSTENMKGVIPEYYTVPEGLFQTYGYAWRHQQPEIDWLSTLYADPTRQTQSPQSILTTKTY